MHCIAFALNSHVFRNTLPIPSRETLLIQLLILTGHTQCASHYSAIDRSFVIRAPCIVFRIVRLYRSDQGLVRSDQSNIHTANSRLDPRLVVIPFALQSSSYVNCYSHVILIIAQGFKPTLSL